MADTEVAHEKRKEPCMSRIKKRASVPRKTKELPDRVQFVMVLAEVLSLPFDPENLASESNSAVLSRLASQLHRSSNQPIVRLIAGEEHLAAESRDDLRRLLQSGELRERIEKSPDRRWLDPEVFASPFERGAFEFTRHSEDLSETGRRRLACLNAWARLFAPDLRSIHEKCAALARGVKGLDGEKLYACIFKRSKLSCEDVSRLSRAYPMSSEGMQEQISRMGLVGVLDFSVWKDPKG